MASLAAQVRSAQVALNTSSFPSFLPPGRGRLGKSKIRQDCINAEAAASRHSDPFAPSSGGEATPKSHAACQSKRAHEGKRTT